MNNIIFSTFILQTIINLKQCYPYVYKSFSNGNQFFNGNKVSE